MHVNAKMIPVEAVPGIGGGGIQESSEQGELRITYLIYYKNLCKCHNVPPPSMTIKEKINNKENIQRTYTNIISATCVTCSC
jgi:hypothetical protein